MELHDINENQLKQQAREALQELLNRWDNRVNKLGAIASIVRTLTYLEGNYSGKLSTARPARAI